MYEGSRVGRIKIIGGEKLSVRMEYKLNFYPEICSKDSTCNFYCMGLLTTSSMRVPASSGSGSRPVRVWCITSNIAA